MPSARCSGCGAVGHLSTNLERYGKCSCGGTFLPDVNPANYVQCDACAATGRLAGAVCDRCSGKGWLGR